MKDILFACDLDNTLIHSWKHRTDGDVCVEWLDGKEQGYMSAETVDLLRTARRKTDFVPVTSRSVAQYQRIIWPQGCEPEFAVTTHGAKLLRNGAEVQSWEDDSCALTAPCLAALESLLTVLEATGAFLRCRMVDQSYAFVYGRDDVRSAQAADGYPLDDSLYRVRSGKKTYFVPEGIDKGTAVERFAKGTPYRLIVCAGDSEMDLPMLTIADIAFAPRTLAIPAHIRGAWRACEGPSFPVEMLRQIIAIAEGM